MSVWLLILVILFLGAPIAKGIGDRIARSGGDSDLLKELRKQLEETHQRLAGSEERIASLEERVDFYERLLSSAEATSRGRERLSAGDRTDSG